MKSDIEIAQIANMLPIQDVASKYGISFDDLELFGKYKAKLSDDLFKKLKDKNDGKLVLVTAINPTPAGEGKTTTTIGLSQALNRLNIKSFVALREPSLGPCMGMKGGATGGGNSQVVPMEDINLHFTGDLHAITTAHNLLSAMLDNHIQQGNQLNIDVRNISWKRALDMNDRSLRNIVIGMGGKVHGVPREESFMITVASEIMAIMCLSENIFDLKERLSKIIVGYDYLGKPITCRDLKAQGAMTALLKDALKPNLVQTLENTPAIIHGGPFANIAHGCNSIKATKLGLKLSDVLITEAGFGADLGAEKFFDIKCRIAGLKPDAVVLVATIRSLKFNGFVQKDELNKEDLQALEKGIVNLEGHIENIKKYGVPVVVGLNVFMADTVKEIEFVKNRCSKLGVRFAISRVWEKGGEGGEDLAKEVIDILENYESNFKLLYEDNISIEEKIRTVAKEIYGAKGVVFSTKAKNQIDKITELGCSEFPVCISKTQYSFSDNPRLLGRPKDFEITINEIRLSAGAGFVVALSGDLMTMPGLPKVPSAERIDVSIDGKISGLS